jgi:hypothetical protein
VTIFVSYRRDDSQSITGRIDDHLRRHFGDKGVFRDIDNIPAGVDFIEHLNGALSRCDICVVVIGRTWASSRLAQTDDFVRLEIESVLRKGIPVIPVLVEGALLPSRDTLPPTLESLVRRQAIRVDSGPDFGSHVAKLVSSIRLSQ